MVGLANTLKIPIVKVGTMDKFANIPSLERTTILLSARFPLAIPRSVFNRYQFAFNVHPTLLPKYRGRYLEPILINGERESGVTIHLIDDEYDSGPIVGQSKYPIGRFDTVATLIRKAEQLEFELIIEALENCQSSSFEMKLQDQSQASFFFTKRTPNDSFIPCTTSLKDALTIVRACDLDSHPAFTIIDDEKVVLSMHRPVKPPDQHDCI
jgi:methionyl-tRNA formyltransferase